MIFYKYSALNNDFVLLDWWDVPTAEVLRRLASPAWSKLVIELCDRKYGIGADGVLIIYQREQQIVAGIFNQDGSDGQFCGNGARSVGQYLHQYRGLPASQQFSMGCNNVLYHCEGNLVTTQIPKGQYLGVCNIQLPEAAWQGHQVNVGNPHLLILSKVDDAWLKSHGGLLENYFGASQRTNVEFVWQQEPQHYQMRIYERGVGYSEACGSGVMALTQLFHDQGVLPVGKKIQISMPGGSAIAWMTVDGKLALQADVNCVFSGEWLANPVF